MFKNIIRRVANFIYTKKYAEYRELDQRLLAELTPIYRTPNEKLESHMCHMLTPGCSSRLLYLSQRWKHHSGDYCYPIPDRRHIGRWEGINGDLRKDLVKYVIKKIKRIHNL